MLIEALRPLCIRRPDGDLHLKPGYPVEIPDDAAVQLLATKPDTVRRVSLPAGHCIICGSGFWIRVTSGSEWRCGRCHPSEVKIESVFVPGGSPPPDALPTDSSPPSKGRAVVEPAAPNARPIYWETGTGEILGPARPESLVRDGDAFWIMTTFEGQSWWINADRLRSKKAFDTQPIVRTIELLREPR